MKYFKDYITNSRDNKSNMLIFAELCIPDKWR